MITSIILLILAALALLFLEIFIPGGLATIIAMVLIAWAAALAVGPYGLDVGILILFIGAILGVLTILVEIKLIKDSPLARFLLHRDAHSTTAVPEVNKELMGTSGVALTPIAPTGKVQIGDKTYTAKSTQGMLAKGQAITVTGRDAFQLIVTKS